MDISGLEGSQEWKEFLVQHIDYLADHTIAKKNEDIVYLFQHNFMQEMRE